MKYSLKVVDGRLSLTINDGQTVYDITASGLTPIYFEQDVHQIFYEKTGMSVAQFIANNSIDQLRVALQNLFIRLLFALQERALNKVEFLGTYVRDPSHICECMATQWTRTINDELELFCTNCGRHEYKVCK